MRLCASALSVRRRRPPRAASADLTVVADEGRAGMRQGVTFFERSSLHFGDNHLGQFQAVTDFRVHNGRVLDFITVQPNRRNDSSRDQVRILGSRRLARSLETVW
jgi:hypothetical protein